MFESAFEEFSYFYFCIWRKCISFVYVLYNYTLSNMGNSIVAHNCQSNSFPIAINNDLDMVFFPSCAYTRDEHIYIYNCIHYHYILYKIRNTHTEQTHHGWNTNKTNIICVLIFIFFRFVPFSKCDHFPLKYCSAINLFPPIDCTR